VTATDFFASGPNSAKALDITTVSEWSLTSPLFNIVDPSTTLSFGNFYNSESGFDGGVLEIKIGAGSFTDILVAGGSFSQNGYNGTLSTGFANPMPGRQAWTGNSGGFITTIVNMPASAVGQTVQLRWRFGTDNSVAISGWWVDDIIMSPLTICQGTFTGPNGSAAVVNTGCATYQVNVNVSGTGQGTTVDIYIDGGLVQSGVGVGGPYGPFGPFANGSNHTIELVDPGAPTCGFTLPTVSSPTVSCDDGDPLTNDACVSNVCQHTPTSCDDGDPCTTDDILVWASEEENFDLDPAPLLPAGWNGSATTGSGVPWITVTDFAQSAPNAAWTDNVSTTSSATLMSAVMFVPGSNAKLSFWHRWAVESGFDGGRLEMQIVAPSPQPFVDVITAGGTWVQNGYNGTVSSQAGLPGWTATSGGAFVNTIVTLPTTGAYAVTPFTLIQFRWIESNDGSVTAAEPNGWWIDSMTLSSVVCQGTFQDADGDATCDFFDGCPQRLQQGRARPVRLWQPRHRHRQRRYGRLQRRLSHGSLEAHPGHLRLRKS
jgi:hypothetical protein